MVNSIREACHNGAPQKKACKIIGIATRTLQRWTIGDKVLPDNRKQTAANNTPANKLTDSETDLILKVANSPEFANLPPNIIVPMLADQGKYIASESSFYRVLREAKQLAHRGNAKPRTVKRPAPLQAHGPNQLWSWDITYLPTNVKGIFLYLYLIMDVFSRKIVGWEIYPTESAEHASLLFKKAYLKEGVAGKDLVLHSDNGSPMKGATMLSTLQRLGVVASFSRPSVSDDNPFSESLFRTLKYHQSYPEQPFATIDDARTWVTGFQHWYNNVHRHSSLKFVTPNQRHEGQDVEILKNRKRIYDEAKSNRPERWTQSTRNWKPKGIVFLNPGKPARKEEVKLKQINE